MPKALNGESVQINLQFTADIAQAKRELKQLQDTLRSITRDPAEGFRLDKQMAEASRYAAELSVHLKKATNPSTGMLDFSRLNESIKKSGMSLSAYGDKLLQLGPQGRQAFSQLATAVSQSEIPIRRVNGALAQMGTVLKNTIRWQLSSTAIHAFSGAIQTAYNYAKDLNESLNNIRIVTGYNIDQMDRFAVTANKAAKALSTSTLDYTNAALIYYQQGLNDQEVEARTNVTAKMANVTKQSAEEVSSQLTAIWNNYAKGADNLEYFADVITALGAATASSSQEISTGLEKFAAVGETVGLSYEYATAALATVTATTRQSAEVVGNAFKTLFARLQGLKQGESFDDGTDLNKYSTALLNVGVNIKNAAGGLKDMDVILDETAAKWRTLGKDQQMALAQTVAGVRQYTQFIALMDNWDFMEKNLQTAYSSSGTLQKQQDIYAESWEAAAKRVKAAWEDVYSALINDDFFIDLLNFVEKAVSGIKNLIGALGGIPGILTTIGSLVMTIFGKQMAEGLTTMTYSIQSLTAHGRTKMINERQEQLNQMGILATQHMTGNGDVDQAWVTSLQQRIMLQDQLTQHVDQLSETERFVAQSLQDQVIERQKLVEEAAHAVELAKNELEIYKDSKFQEAREQNPQLQRAAFDDAWKGLNNSSTKTLDFDEDPFSYVKRNTQYKNIDVSRIQQDAKEILHQYANQLDSSAEGKVIQEKLQNLLRIDPKITSQEGLKGIKDFVRNLQKELLSLTTTVDAESRDKLARMGTSVDGLTEHVDNLTAAEASLANAQKSVQTAIDGVINFIDAASQKTMTWQQQLVSFGQVAMSAGMLFNQLSGLISTWDNDDLNFGEKLVSSLTSIGMILPMLVSGYKTLESSIDAITLKHQLAVMAQAKGLTISQAQLAVGALKKLQAAQELTDEEKVVAAKALGLSEEKASVAIGIIQKVLNKEKLTLAEALVGQKLGILTYETLENGQLVIHLTLQKAINKVVKSNPIVAIIGAAIAALMLFAAILKKVKEDEKQRLEQQRDADKETLGKTKERISEMQEESKELHSLVTALQETNDAYNRNEASKEDLFNATKNLVDQYEIEGAELLLLQGRYDELTAAANKYEAAENQRKIRELKDKQTEGLKGARTSDIRLSGIELQGIYNQLSPEQQALIGGYWDENSLSGKFSFQKPTNSDEVIQQYELLKSIKDIALAQGSNTSGIDAEIKALQEYYDTAIAIRDELSTRTDQATGYNALFGDDGVADFEANINNAEVALDTLVEAYRKAGYSADEAKSKAEAYLKTIGGWSDVLVTQEALQQKAAASGVDYDTLLNIYNQLSEGEQAVLFRINIAYGSSESAILEAIKTGSVEVEMQIHQANANALSTASGHFKKGMSKKETEDWAKKYGVDFGNENSAMGIDIDTFMSKTDEQKQNYIAQRLADEQGQAYEAAVQYSQKYTGTDLGKKQGLLAKREGLESALAHLIGVDPETQVEIQRQIDNINNQLNEIDSSEAAGNIISTEDAINLERFSSAIEKVKDIKLGDTISNDEIINFTKGIGEGLEDYFVQNGDGTWTLVVDQIQLKEGIREALSGKGKLSEDQQRTIAEMATNYNELGADQSNFGINQDIVADSVQRLATKYENCSQALIEYKKAYKNADKDPKKARQAYLDLIKALKIEEFKEAAKNIKELTKDFKQLAGAEKEVASTKINTELKKIFGEGFKVDDQFIEDHWSSVEKLTNGDEKIVKQGVNEIIDAYEKAELVRDNILAGNAEAFEWTITLDDGEAIQVANEWTALLESLPDEVKSEVVLEDGNVDVSKVLGAIGQIKDGAALASSFLKTLASSNANISVDQLGELESILAALQSAQNTGDFDDYAENMVAFLKALSNINVQASGNVDTRVGTSLGSTGGGGGGSKAKEYKKEEYRYETQTERLSDLEKELDRISKAKDRAFGAERVKIIENEIKALDKYIDEQKILLDQVNDFVEVDRNRLLNGEENAFSLVLKDAKEASWHNATSIPQMLQDINSELQLTFDEYGNINNVEAIKTEIDRWRNEAVALANAGTFTEDDLAIAEKKHDWAMNTIEQYTETVNKQIEEADKLQEQVWKKQDLYAEKINTQIEYRIQLEKNELDMIERKLRIIENNMYKSIEAADLLNQKFKNTLDNSGKLQDDFNKWETAFANGEISPEKYREEMQNIFAQAGESIEDIMSQWENMSQYYADVLDKFDSRLRFETKVFGDLIDELEYYSELLSLTGREQDYDKQLQVIRGQQEILKDRLDTSRATQKIYQDEYDAFRAAYDTAVAAGDTDKAEFLFPSLQAASEKLDDINGQIREDIKQLAELANKEFSTTLDKIYKNAEKAVTNQLGFDYLAQTMDLASERADVYLTKTNQIYETSQMLRDINRDIDKTDNTSAKARLKNFSEEIQALQEKGELSHYELEDAKARYEILKAQIALEEAQNAKSIIRLQRDTEGSYGYVYTADRDKVDKAADDLAKAQNDRYNLALDNQQEYLRKFYETEQAANEALRALDEERANDRSMTEEEYQRRRTEIITYYSDILSSYEEVQTLAIVVMNETAAQRTNDSWTNTFGSVGGNGLIGKADEWKTQTVNDSITVDAAFKSLTSTLSTYVEPEYDNFAQRIQTATDKSEALREKLVDEFLPEMDSVIDGIKDMELAWADYTNQLREALQALLDLQSAANANISVGIEDNTPDYSKRILDTFMSNGHVIDQTITSLFTARQAKINANGGVTDVDNSRIMTLLNAAMGDNPDPKATHILTEVAEGRAYFTDELLKKYNFKSGGYTGNWVGGSDLYSGKLAMLHEKELVLNAEDTKNMLAAVHLVRQISQAVDLQAQLASGGNISAPGWGGGSSILEQTVTIHAEFPNATNHSEIEEAFNNLVNRASQYANRK